MRDSARALSEAKAQGMSFFQLPRQDYIRMFQGRKMEAKAPAAAAAMDPQHGATAPR